MAEQDLRKWTSFFDEAGVPRGPSTEYATLFCNHRIKEHLLGDLTKDILNDIGITVMGDIMSILKYAKAVHAKLEREKLSNRLASNLANRTAVDNDSQLPTRQNKKKTPVNLLNKPKAPEVRLTGVISNKPMKVLANGTNTNKELLTAENPASVSNKRPMNNNLSLSERFAGEKVVPSKVPRESSEMTGTNFIIKTKKSPLNETSIQQVHKGVKTNPPKRKSAFERLGKELKSAEKETNMMPKMKLTKITMSPIKASSTPSPINKGGSSSVFNRLGETEPKPSGNKITTMTVRKVTGLGSRIVSDGSDEKYTKSGVLRPIKPMRAVRPVKPVSQVNTIVKTPSFPDKKSVPKKEKESVFSRLGSPT